MPLLKPIPRKEGVDDRTVWVGLFGRFTDELLAGLFSVLTPTFRQLFGLSLPQAALLVQLLEYVALVVEPVAALLNDVWQRKWIMAFGALFCGLALITMGLAPTFIVLAVGFALYGIGTGPLAHTADILLVETHPDAPDRIFNRSTILDTIGALLAPLLVSAVFFLGLDWRWLVIVAGGVGVLYAWIIGRTNFPPVTSEDEAPSSLFSTLRQNLKTVLSDTTARGWLIFLFLLNIFEAPQFLRPIWLNETVGMSQTLIGSYVAFEFAISFLALLLLERLRERISAQRVLVFSLITLLICTPFWLLLPGIATRFLLTIPITTAQTMLWPISKGQSLAAVPGKSGAITAVTSTFSIVPFAVFFGLLAEALTHTNAMLVTYTVSVLALLLLTVSVLKR